MTEHKSAVRGRVDPRDGPVARIGTVEWQAWQDYYKTNGRWFSAQLQRQYKAHGTDWPVTTQWPPGISEAMKDHADQS